MSQSKITQERFNEKMNALDKENPAPLARFMASDEQCADPIVERNVSLLRQRSTVGVQKYGTTLADNNLSLRAWLNHALEESLDHANYLQAAMAEIDSATSKVEDTAEDAELFGIGYLVDGVNVHPSRVTVLRPSIAATPAAQPEARKPIMWAALNMNGKAVCVNQDKSACDIERLCIKTPTTIVPLYAGAPEPQ